MIYMLVVIILLGYILNDLSKKYSHTNINFDRQLSKEAVEPGEEFDIVDIVENRKLLPVAFLQILEEVPKQLVYKTKTGVPDFSGNAVHEITMSMMPNQRIKRTYKASISERGLYIFNRTRLVVGDFLGTETKTMDCSIVKEVVVYPKAACIESEIKPHGSYYGDISVQRWIINDPVLNIGIREYTGSEPQKNIHWASSLRMGKLMVKNFDYTTDNMVRLVLNIESQKPFWSGVDIDKIERCISITRTLMEQLEQSGVQYGFTSNAQSTEFNGNSSGIAYGQGSAHFYNMLEVLGRVNYGIHATFEELLEELIKANEKNTTYILVTPSVMDGYADPINCLGNNAQKTVLISIDENNLDGISSRIMTFAGKDEEDERNS